MKQSDRQTWIDAVKGWAILGVVWIHSGADNFNGAIGALGRAGARGVQFFYVISAFLTWASLERHMEKTGFHWSFKNLFLWYLKKVIRIAPLYYLSIFLCMVSGHFEEYWIGSIGHISVWNYVSHFLFINGFNPYFVACLYGEGYITMLMIWYMLAPLIYKHIHNFKRSFVFWGISIFGSFLIPRLCSYLPCPLPGKDLYIWEAYIGISWIPAQIGVLATGIFLYYIYIYFQGKTKSLAMSWTAFSLSVLLMVGLIFGRSHIAGVTNITLWGGVA